MYGERDLFPTRWCRRESPAIRRNDSFSPPSIDPARHGGSLKIMDETPQDIAKAVAAIGRIDAVPTLLGVLCEITGMRFAVVARVTGKIWTACAVQDDIPLGVKVGGQLALRTNLAFESQASRTPIVVEHASTDPRYRTNAGPKIYQIESYISVPIFLPGDRYFGNLC